MADDTWNQFLSQLNSLKDSYSTSKNIEAVENVDEGTRKLILEGWKSGKPLNIDKIKLPTDVVKLIEKILVSRSGRKTFKPLPPLKALKGTPASLGFTSSGGPPREAVREVAREPVIMSPPRGPPRAAASTAQPVPAATQNATPTAQSNANALPNALPNEYIAGVQDLGMITRPYAPQSRLAVQAIGEFPEIPSINVRNSKTGLVQDCKAWFTERLQKSENMPAKTSVAGAYLDANGDATQQAARRDEIIGYICDHDVNARRIMESVGKTIRSLLKKTLMIPQLLAENARLCACNVRPDLIDDQRLLMEQLAYMAMQMKRLTDSLDFSYDPATKTFYKLDEKGDIKEALDPSNFHPIFGLDVEEVKELWDVLSSSQTGVLYGQKLDIYPEHKACDGTTVRTQMFNIILHFATTPAELLAAAKLDSPDHDALKDAVARVYLLRLWELTAPTGESPKVATAYKMSYNKAYSTEIYPSIAALLRPYIGIVPTEEGGVRVFFRIPQDFFETSVPDMSTALAAVIGANTGNDVKQLALTSLVIRPPKFSQDAVGADSWLSQAYASNKKMDISFLTYDELDPAKFNPPGILVK